jgi:hypothetical protein
MCLGNAAGDGGRGLPGSWVCVPLPSLVSHWPMWTWIVHVYADNQRGIAQPGSPEFELTDMSQLNLRHISFELLSIYHSSWRGLPTLM